LAFWDWGIWRKSEKKAAFVMHPGSDLGLIIASAGLIIWARLAIAGSHWQGPPLMEAAMARSALEEDYGTFSTLLMVGHRPMPDQKTPGGAGRSFPASRMYGSWSPRM